MIKRAIGRESIIEWSESMCNVGNIPVRFSINFCHSNVIK